MDKNFTFKDQNFQLRKIDAFKQFHIVRRMAPILGGVLPALGSVKKTMGSELTEEEKFDQYAKILSPMMEGLSKLSDEDSDKVLKGLLSGVEIQQAGGNWASVVVDGQLMFSNLTLPTMLNAALKSFMFNLSDFFDILPQVSPGKG